MSDLQKRRLKANKELAELLSQMVEDYPHLRFGQILESFGFVKVQKISDLSDDYGEMGDEHIWQRDVQLEPMDLLKRVAHEVERLQAQNTRC